MELNPKFEIPSPYNKLFEHYECFNAVQSHLLNDLLKTDKSIVLKAPTGSGKTLAFELAIVRMLLNANSSSSNLNDSSTQAESQHCPPKAIYVAPTKALCAEKFADWQRRIDQPHIGCQVLQLTGDSEVGDSLVLCGAQQSQLVVTTPEKWLSLVRRWSEFEEVVRAVRLLMVDEVHLLGDELRGPTLEALVTRMKVALTADTPMRLVVASATISNTDDLAAWLGAAAHNSDVTQLTFNNSQRPVLLQRHVVGFNSKLKGFQFDLSLNYKLVGIVRQYAENGATLVFCNSRKSAEMAAAIVTRHGRVFQLSAEQQLQLTQLAQRLNDVKLKKLVVCGVAYHHAGLTYADRNLIEQYFRNRTLMIVLATNTLATGVNLPAHLVIIKSTETYNRGCMEEYSESAILQMIGRAGRPQYDTKGVAVIMTHSCNVRRYENLMSADTPVESHLHKHLTEHLNSEIALSTIDTLAAAMNWLRATFLYVRALRSPLAYGLMGNVSREFVEHKLQEKCLMVIDELHAAGLVVRHGAHAGALVATPAGKLMAKYSLSFDTMRAIQQVRGNEGMLQLLKLLARCKEFDEFTLRASEKSALNALNETPLRYPIPGRIKLREQKILCLIQAALGNASIGEPGLAQEVPRIMRIADRLANCLLEYLHLVRAQRSEQQPTQPQFGTEGGSCYRALLHAVTIAKCFHARLWENSEFAAKQLRKIGIVHASLFASAGKRTLQSIAETDVRTIEELLQKPSPFGEELLQNLLETCPQYEMQLHLVTTATAGAATQASATSTTAIAPPLEQHELHIRLAQVNELYVLKDVDVVLIVGDSANNLLLYESNVVDLMRHHNVHELRIPVVRPEVQYISAHVIHSTLVGVDAVAKIVLNATADTGPDVDTSDLLMLPKRKARQTKSATMAKRQRGNNKPPPAKCGAPSSGSENSFETVSTAADDSFLAGLKQFVATAKSKLVDAKACNQTIASVDMNETGQSDLIQTKVTKFFAQRKTFFNIDHDNNTNGDDINEDESAAECAEIEELPIVCSSTTMDASESAVLDARNTTFIAEVDLNIEDVDNGSKDEQHFEEISTVEPLRRTSDSCLDIVPHYNCSSIAPPIEKTGVLSATTHCVAPSAAPSVATCFGFWNQSTTVDPIEEVQEIQNHCSSAAAMTTGKLISIEEQAVVDKAIPVMCTTPDVEHRFNASEDTQRFWYNVCRKFQRLQSYHQNFSNFQKVYKCCCQTDKRSGDLQSKFNSTFQSHAYVVPGVSTQRNFKAPPPLQLPQQQESTITPDTLASLGGWPIADNNQRYRLQIFAEPPQVANVKSETTNICVTESEANPRISEINRCIMRHVMSQKLTQQPLRMMTQPSPSQAESQKMFLEIETQLLQMDCEDALEDMLGFDELCRLYLDDPNA